MYRTRKKKKKVKRMILRAWTNSTEQNDLIVSAQGDS